MSAFDDQRKAAAHDLALRWPTLAHLGELALVPPPAWPGWLVEAVRFHNAALAADARGCEHLVGRGPLPACAAPVKAPGRVWCTGCAEDVVRHLLAEDDRCDGCPGTSVYSVAVPVENTLDLVFVCPGCRQQLIPDGDL